jgi:hypothetical protein
MWFYTYCIKYKLLVAKAKLGDKWMDPHSDIIVNPRQNDQRKKQKKLNSQVWKLITLISCKNG